MPNFSSGEVTKIFFELKPKAAFFEPITNSDGSLTYIDKFQAIQELNNRGSDYLEFSSIEFYKDPSPKNLSILL